MQIDETTSSDGRCVANVIIGILTSYESRKSFLVNCVDLEGKFNHQKICGVIDDAIKMIWHDNFDKEKLLLFITDGASYMKTAGKCLKAFYPKVIHVTCMAHLVNRLAAFIRMEDVLTDKFIAKNKKIFTKSRSRIEKFKEFAPEISLPLKPVITRWSTWLDAAFYCAKNYDKIAQVVNSFDSSEALCIGKVQKLLTQQNLKNELSYLKANFGVLTKIQAAIQRNDLLMSDAFDLIDNLKVKCKMSKVLLDKDLMTN